MRHARAGAAAAVALTVLISGCGFGGGTHNAPVPAITPTASATETDDDEGALTDEAFSEELPDAGRPSANPEKPDAEGPAKQSATAAASASATPSAAAPRASRRASPAPPAQPTPVVGPVARLVHESPATGEPLSVITMRHGVHPTYERVVIELAGNGKPGWQAHYVDRPTHDGSGEPVGLAGQSSLRLTVVGVAPPPTGDPYRGPAVIGSQHNAPIVEVRRGVVVEGRQEFWIGLRSERPVKVGWLPGPPRIIVDIPR